MKDRLEERLGQLRIGDPDPILRDKVLAAAEAGFDSAPGQTSWREWLAAWRMEALLSGAVAAAALLLLLMNGSTGQWQAPTAWIDESAARDVVNELDLNPGMESHYRARLAWTVRRLAATRRVGHGKGITEQIEY